MVRGPELCGRVFSPLFLFPMGVEPGLVSSPSLLCLLQRELLVRRAGDVKQEENMRNADILLLESYLPLQPVLACMFSHTLRHLGKRSVGVGVRQTQVALWPHCWLSL